MRKTKLDPVYLSAFCMELSLLLESGITIDEGIALLREEESDRKARTVLEGVEQALSQGDTFSEALVETEAFPQYMLDAISQAEVSGRLDSVLGALSQYFDRQENISRSLRSAVFYPVLLFFMMMAVIGILIVRVLPIFENVFGQLGVAMSPVATALLQAGFFLGDNAAVLLGILIGIVVICLLLFFIPKARQGVKSVWNRVTAGSRLRLRIASARFASSMAMHMASGLDTDQALEKMEQLESNAPIRNKILLCQEKMKEDDMPFAQALSESELFSPFYCRMLSVGIRTGNADRVMEEIARRSETDAYDGIERTIGRIEPILVFAMSLLVGLVLLSVLLPLADIMSALG